MLLLERQQCRMNDSLEKMYPLLNSIKQATIWYLEGQNQEKITGRTISLDTIREVAEKLYKEWTRRTTKTDSYVIPFSSLLKFEERPFMVAAAEVMEITLREHTEIVYPLQPRRTKAEFIRNPFDNEIYIVLKKGDYAYVYRNLEEEAKKA